MHAIGSSTKFNPNEASTSHFIRHIRDLLSLSQSELAQLLGTSYISIVRLEREDSSSSSDLLHRLNTLYADICAGERPSVRASHTQHVFASRGASRVASLPLFAQSNIDKVKLTKSPCAHIVSRLKDKSFWGDGRSTLISLLADYDKASPTLSKPAESSVSAGKNTYTYDAHTYHTKVPPQGIAQIIKQYLPEGGLVLDPFAGSGMTGVAVKTLGYDAILNDLSPAAGFIADRFTRQIEPSRFAEGVRVVCEAIQDVRDSLYTTECRECRKKTEILYTVWSYEVSCPKCSTKFVLWDHCRSYGSNVKEHKILSQFDCPCCKSSIKKSRLLRTNAVPVMLGYKCCSRIQMEHPLSQSDLLAVQKIENKPSLAFGYFPTLPLPDGVNLNQPKRHGLDSIDKLYTTRNLVAASHIWRAIHRIKDDDLAGYLAFAFTSLYQRITRLSEFRFWGGSGNTANYNVPYIFNEANVFKTFERKARSIQDHLETTAQHYTGRCVVHTGSATALSFLPDASIDLVFTDPPFGANINYSEMNLLWESWLCDFTDATDEAIVSKAQGKDAAAYGELMRQSLAECHRVLRPGHWMLLVFMNSSASIWDQLQNAIYEAGFSIERMDVFDKQHGTFKQFVSDNTAGADLILHCKKANRIGKKQSFKKIPIINMVEAFLDSRTGKIPMLPYLHVNRKAETDYRTLYSEWLSHGLLDQGSICDFATFRSMVASYLIQKGQG